MKSAFLKKTVKSMQENSKQFNIRYLYLGVMTTRMAIRQGIILSEVKMVTL